MSTVAMGGRSTTTVRCECGDVFELSVRTDRRHRAQGTRPRCVICRRRALRIVSSQQFHNYWLKRYSAEWIQETAALIWGKPGGRDEE